MGRRKLNMKLIETEKSRAATMKKRIKGLEKKAHEFTTLCDVQACMIIFEPELMNNPAKLQIWPSDPARVKSVIENYRTKVLEEKKISFFSVFDFFNRRKRQVHDEVAQARTANFKAKFPKSDDLIDGLASSAEMIESLLAKLDRKLEVVKQRIALMKGDTDRQLLHYSKPNIQAHIPVHILNDFDEIQGFGNGNSLSSPADEALVKLSLSSMFNLDRFRGPSGNINASTSNSSGGVCMQNNMLLYNPPLSPHPSPPPPSFPVDLKFGLSSNNNVMFNHQLSSTAVVHDAWSNAMQNSILFNEPLPPYQTCFYGPSSSKQPETAAAYNWQQSMMMMMPPPPPPRHGFSQLMHPSHQQLMDFYHDTDEHEMRNKKPRF